ncbi:putative elongation factor 1B gamma, elongation factor EF1B gamma domain superfamily [Helianthus anomalus]
MILDDWKRLYSNTKTNFREAAIKGFWEMFDPEGYSLWFCNYKYNDENTVSFVTMNKVGGFLQRMDLARKYAFGKMLIIGNEPPFKLYEWRKVDPSDEVQKERVNQMFEDHEPFEGETLLDAKCFK